MGEFNKRHLDLITYSSICHAKTVFDLYTGNINKNIRITYIPFCFETGNDMLAYIIFEHAGWDCFTAAWLVARVA